MYQLLYILPAIYAEDELKKEIERVETVLKAASAVNLESKNLGKIKLAYPIKKYEYGVYVLSSFESAGEALKEINRALKLESGILRSSIAKGTVKKDVKLAEFKEVDVSEKRRVRKETRPAAAMKEKEKITIEELDEKLESLLEKEIV